MKQDSSTIHSIIEELEKLIASDQLEMYYDGNIVAMTGDILVAESSFLTNDGKLRIIVKLGDR